MHIHVIAAVVNPKSPAPTPNDRPAALIAELVVAPVVAAVPVDFAVTLAELDDPAVEFVLY